MLLSAVFKGCVGVDCGWRLGREIQEEKSVVLLVRIQSWDAADGLSG